MMRKSSVDIHVVFSIVVAFIACAALAVAVINKREISRLKKTGKISVEETVEKKKEKRHIRKSKIKSQTATKEPPAKKTKTIKKEKSTPASEFSTSIFPEKEHATLPDDEPDIDETNRGLDEIVKDLVDTVIEQ